MDEWWNRAFAPHSTKRLFCLLAVYPLIGLLIEAGMGRLFPQLPVEFGVRPLDPGFSWIRYVVLTVSGMGVLSLLRFSGSLHVAADTSQRAARPEAEPAPIREYRPSWADFATGMPFGAGCVLSMMWGSSSR